MKYEIQNNKYSTLGISFLCFVVVLGITLILGLVRMLKGKSGKI